MSIRPGVTNNPGTLTTCRACAAGPGGHLADFAARNADIHDGVNLIPGVNNMSAFNKEVKLLPPRNSGESPEIQAHGNKDAFLCSQFSSCRCNLLHYRPR